MDSEGGSMASCAKSARLHKAVIIAVEPGCFIWAAVVLRGCSVVSRLSAAVRCVA